MGALWSSKLQHLASGKKRAEKSRSEKTNDGGWLKPKVVHLHNHIYSRRRCWRRRLPKGMTAGATGQIDFGGTKMMWDHREVNTPSCGVHAWLDHYRRRHITLSAVRFACIQYGIITCCIPRKRLHYYCLQYKCRRNCLHKMSFPRDRVIWKLLCKAKMGHGNPNPSNLPTW